MTGSEAPRDLLEALLEGLVREAVSVVEERDPMAVGHSARVAVLACDLAERVTKAASGPLENVHFTSEEVRELRYAALLHDLGMIDVGERVLTKSTRLPAGTLETIELRLELVGRSLEAGYQERRGLLIATQGPGSRLLTHLKKEFHEGLERVDRYRQSIRDANEPGPLTDEARALLREIAASQYPDIKGNLRPYITPEELRFLVIERGTLDVRERRSVEAHAQRTYEILARIPWTDDLARVPEFARAHHERLDGTGYPLGLEGSDIPIQVRILTVSDVFDALTQERPYRKALTPDDALVALEREASQGRIDGDVVELLIQARRSPT